jgi:hypothetical protein
MRGIHGGKVGVVGTQVEGVVDGLAVEAVEADLGEAVALNSRLKGSLKDLLRGGLQRFMLT